jgi:hypothetical protein
VHGGRGDQALDFAFANRAFFLIRRTEGLDLLETVAAGFAAIFIKRHLS